MSFEGYYQILCKNGHCTETNCYDEPNFEGPEFEEVYDKVVCRYPLWRCDCGETAAWWHLVDSTNGSFCTNPSCDGDCKYCDNGRIDGYVKLELKTIEKKERCNLGYEHVVKEATYKIPKTKGNVVK